MNKLISFLLLLSFSSASIAEVDSVSAFEKAIEEKIKEIALVQFGTGEALVVSVKANLKPVQNDDIAEKNRAKAKAKADADAESAKVEAMDYSLDVGYLPLPVSKNFSQKKKENLVPSEEVEKAKPIIPIQDKIESVDIQLLTSSLAEKNSIKNLELNIKNIFSKYNPKISVRAVNASNLKPRKLDPPVAKNPDDKEDKNKDESANQIQTKDIVFYSLIFVCVILLCTFLFLGMRSVSNALIKSFEAVGQGLISLKQTGSTTMKKNGLNGTNADVQNPNDEGHVGKKGASASGPYIGQFESSIEKLKAFCRQEPMKVVSTLTMDNADIIGLRWLFSLLDDSDLRQLKSFLGPDRMKLIHQPVAAPDGFSLQTWTQKCVERITLLKLDGLAFIERCLDPSQLSKLYSLSEDNCFNLASELNRKEFWKIALEKISSDYILLNSSQLSEGNWKSILDSSDLASDVVRASADEFFAEYDRRFVNDEKETQTDDRFKKKILDTLIATLKTLESGKDSEFIEKVKHDKPEIAQSLSQFYWPVSRLNEVDKVALKGFLVNLTNESLFALMLCSTEQIRGLITNSLPEGMKKTVAIDLYEKAKAKNDSKDLASAQKLAKETMEKALALHLKGQLPLQKGLAA